MNTTGHRRLTWVLGILGVLLLGFSVAVSFGWGQRLHWHDNDQPPRLPQSNTLSHISNPIPLTHYATVWEEPLFSPTRTPGTVNPAASVASNFILTGVVMVPGLEMAILQDKDTGQSYCLRKGVSSGRSPVLLSLKARSAVIETSGQSRLLQLKPSASLENTSSQNDSSKELEQDYGCGVATKVSEEAVK